MKRVANKVTAASLTFIAGMALWSILLTNPLPAAVIVLGAPQARWKG